MRKYRGSKLPRTFVGLHLFLEVRICNALLCSTKVFGVSVGVSALLLQLRGLSDLR